MRSVSPLDKLLSSPTLACFCLCFSGGECAAPPPVGSWGASTGIRGRRPAHRQRRQIFSRRSFHCLI
ncbi:hypothetical protein GUJ93_ZPchr0008g12237 [Zizania palustris]|uniref:Uncharacterized protein n=1 Tax=Zizania palustris TaxID=103762 RepID=A0A8J5RWN2_ZIZPA|nr:hypothetical protein GUJ93_ZPchr0008g12237 [Zizania palustris]